MAAVPATNARSLPTSLTDPSAAKSILLMADASFVGATSRSACAARRAAAMKFDLLSQSGLTDSLTAPRTDSEARTRSADEAALSPRAFPAAVSPGSSGDRVGSIGRCSVAENAADLGVIGAVEAKSVVEGVVGFSGALYGFDVTSAAGERQSAFGAGGGSGGAALLPRRSISAAAGRS